MKLSGLLLLAFLVSAAFRGTDEMQFVIDRKECFDHDVEYEGDTVRVSFVVLKATENAWDAVVDLVIQGPNNFRTEVTGKSAHNFNFNARERGTHKFCFHNKSPYHETIDYDVHVGHIPYYEEHAKDDHFDPLMTQIRRLEEAIYSVQFEQHWLQAQTDRQKLLNEKMSRRVIHKTLLESAGLIAASLLQVYLLRRLFERKLGTSMV